MSTEVEIINIMKNWYFYRTAEWTKKFAWLPKRCDRTRKLIWLTHGYNGTTTVEIAAFDMGMNKTVTIDTRWLTKQEFILFALTKKFD